VALNVGVSEQDRQSLKRLVPAARIAIVPNGVDLDEFRPDGTAGRGVAFVGGLPWFLNRDALEFFGEAILPHVRAVGGDVPVVWIGSASDEERRHYRERFGVEVTGYLDDVKPLMHGAAVHIVPLRAGGGTRLKILNSWAMGKPIVTTTIGCEGLDAIDGENALVRDDPKAFAEAIVTLLRDGRLARHLGDVGRATAARHYSWERIGEHLGQTYSELANDDKALAS